MFFNKEKRNLLKARTKSLINAEKKVEELSKENKVLRYKNKELEQFKNEVIQTMNQKATIVDKYDIIKELVSDYQS